MTKEDGSAVIESACENEALICLADKYVASCNTEKEETGETKQKRKAAARFPNVAGFCRFFGIGQTEYLRLSKKYPEEFEKLFCVLEDEALNSEISPTLLGAYLKRRLGYDEAKAPPKSDVDVGQLRLIFEHDILADGE